MRFRIFLSAVLLFSVLPVRAQFVISELFAGDSNSIAVEDGNSEDWIEIQNAGAATVSLPGWHLTDNSNHPRKWAFIPAPGTPKAGGGEDLQVRSGGSTGC